MIFLSTYSKKLDSFKHKYYLEICVEKNNFCFKIKEEEKTIVQKTIKINNVEQMLNFCDGLELCLSELRFQIGNKTLLINDELKKKDVKTTVDFGIDTNKDLLEQVMLKIEKVVFNEH